LAAAEWIIPGPRLTAPNCFVKIRLFIKPYCGWCQQAMRWLDARGIKYEVLDVIADAEAFSEMEELSGQTLAPVIDVDGEILADFGAEELAKFWEKLKQQ
jgi:glutaredoxin 3